MNNLINGALRISRPILRPTEFPLRIASDFFDFTVQPWLLLAYYVLVLLAVFTVIRWAWGKVQDVLFKRKSMLVQTDVSALASSDPEFTRTLEATKYPELTINPLIKAKKWGELAELYASLNEHKKAAKYFKKDRKYAQAAHELSKVGETAAAAKLLAKAGDFELSGRFYRETGRHAKAAVSFEKGGHWADAAEEYRLARKPAKAYPAYTRAFTEEGGVANGAAAVGCYELLKDEKALEKLKEADRPQLFAALAGALSAAGNYPAAADVYARNSDFINAGKACAAAGDLQQAAAYFKQAGDPAKAARAAAEFHEQRAAWKEAAEQYVLAQDLKKAGECFAKANEFARAAECFMRLRDYYRGGRAFARAGRFQDAVVALQQMAESDPDWHRSRALLGRCFYELHDYAHCAAVLDNHLLNQRVTADNMDYFYMLALAKEQLGELSESRDLLYKISATRRDFRDVDTRISNIVSRISMMGSEQRPLTPAEMPTRAVDPAARQVVENSIGERYIIEKELGRGGMGVVYLAKDKQLERPVALKFLGALVDHSEEYKQRFIREARSAAKVSHPNVVSIYDISAQSGKAYIAMEYVEGATLSRYLKQKGKLTVREALNITLQACSALQAVHESGVVHRDLKPDNIILGKGGLVKIMDFGLAKAADNRITKANVVMGTPCYMSPEQALGQDASPASDLYSLGLILHEMLTGKVVFLEGDVMQRQINETPPPPSAAVPDLPPEVDTLVLRCLEKDSAHRFAAAKELAEAIRKLPKEQPA